MSRSGVGAFAVRDLRHPRAEETIRMLVRQLTGDACDMRLGEETRPGGARDRRATPDGADGIVATYMRGVIRCRWPVLAVCLLVAATAASGLRHLRTTADHRAYFGPENPELLAFEALEPIYTKTENLLFVLQPQNKDVFNAKPVFLTSLATTIGFLSLNFSDAPPSHDLGNTTAMPQLSLLPRGGFLITIRSRLRTPASR